MKRPKPDVILLHILATLALCVVMGCSSAKSLSCPSKKTDMSGEIERLGAMYADKIEALKNNNTDDYTGLPASFRGIVPLYRGAIVHKISEHKGWRQSGEQARFRSDATPETIAGFYIKTMNEKGWKEQLVQKTRATQLIFTKGNQVFKARLSPWRGGRGGTTGSLMLYKIIPDQEAVELPPLLKELVPLSQDSTVENATSSDNSESAALRVTAGRDETVAFYKKALRKKGWALRDENSTGQFRLSCRKIYNGRDITLTLRITENSTTPPRTRAKLSLSWK